MTATLLAAVALVTVVASSTAWLVLEMYCTPRRKCAVMRFRTLNRQITVEADPAADQHTFDTWLYQRRGEIDKQECLDTCSQIMDAFPDVLAVECWHASGHIGTAVRNGRY
jgi:hypothetical protein